MKRLLIIVFLASGISCFGQKPYDISVKNVERIITELAADEMMGRRTFTPGIDMAADVIAGEFEEIGLDFLAEEKDYFQAFEMFSVEVSEASIVIDGNELEPSSYFALPDNENMVIEDPGTIVYIRKGENFRARYQEVRASGKDVVALVDPSHAGLFGRYRAFFSNAQRKTELGKGSNVVFAIYNGDNVTNVNVNVNAKVSKQGLKNVAGMIPGNRTDEFVLFSAHYDHIGIQAPVNGDSIANGANDDASGTTAVVELARYFKSLGKPERTILFVAFTAEEMGGYGSRYFSEKLDPEQIVAMFNIEMIGKPAVEGPNTAWITGFDKSSFGKLLQESAEGTIYKFYPDPYPTQNLFYRSDNATLARLGVPAHSISTTPIDVDKDYHQVSDEVSTLNLEHLTNTIKAIAAAARGMVDGKQTPTRVDPSSID